MENSWQLSCEQKHKNAQKSNTRPNTKKEYETNQFEGRCCCYCFISQTKVPINVFFIPTSCFLWTSYAHMRQNAMLVTRSTRYEIRNISFRMRWTLGAWNQNLNNKRKKIPSMFNIVFICLILSFFFLLSFQ